MPPSKIYYPLLDVLRFFAAFWVMNFHYLAGLELSTSLSWYRYGNLGVQLFFIISGFVIVQSLHGKTLEEFATGRFIRLFPLFWILCTATFLLTILVPHTSHVSFHGYLANMTMIPDVINGFLGHGSLVDASYWTLTVELLFYIGIGLFCHIFSYKNIRYFLTVWLLFSAFAFMMHIDQNFYVKLFLVRHASYFIFGSALALIATKQAKNIFEKCLDWGLLVIAAVYSVLIHTRAIPAYVTPNPRDAGIITILLIIFFVAIPVIVYLSSYVKNPRLIRILAVIGGLTYPVYLLHQRVGNIAINYFTNRFNIPWNTFAIWFELVIIAAGYLIYVQDKKLRKWLQKKLMA